MIGLLIACVFILGIFFGWLTGSSATKDPNDPNFFDADHEWNRIHGSPKVIFHGGCHGCSMQDKHGIAYCTGCKYFECNWNLPDLNDHHARREAKMNSIRLRAKTDSRKN